MNNPQDILYFFLILVVLYLIANTLFGCDSFTNTLEKTKQHKQTQLERLQQKNKSILEYVLTAPQTTR